MEIAYRLADIDSIAHQLFEAAQHRRVWAFDGEMGSGKTTLIHALCNYRKTTGSFGSPTFSIINEYESPGGSIYHIDLYRCKNEEEAMRAGVEDTLYSGAQCFVEWPSRAPAILPPDTFRLSIAVEDEQTRKISF